jgi:hypothetical protein
VVELKEFGIEFLANAGLWLGQPSCDSGNPRFLGVLGKSPQMQIGPDQEILA